MVGFALLLLPILTLANEPPPPAQTTVKRDPNTVLVLFGTRHGNRNPERFVNTPDRTWGKEGELELTSIGKRQAYGLGREIRSFVDGFVDSNYFPNQGKFYSSSANRCQMTLQSALAGVYDPKDWADWNTDKLDHWSPVPYTIDDPLLRMYSVKGCTGSDEAWKPITDDTLPDLAELVKRSQNLLQYMKEKDGRNPTISNAADIADNIINMDFYNATYPDWLASPTLAGFTAASIKQAYLSFAEKHMNECAAYKPCRDMMGGLWADHILNALDGRASNKTTTRLIGYASHTEVTLSVMIILGIRKTELTTSAGFVVELRNTSSSPHVRLLQHDPMPIDNHVIYQAHLVPELSSKSDADGWMPLSALKEYVSRASFSNWESLCGINHCATQSSAQAPAPPSSGITSTISCTYTDMLSALECSQLTDTLGCDHPHSLTYCAKSCLCTSITSNIQRNQANTQWNAPNTGYTSIVASLPSSPNSQSLSISQIGNSPSIIASYPMTYQTYPGGSYSASYVLYGK